MTREEAIGVIKSECYVFNPLNFDKSTRINTALDMAIEALEQEPRKGHWIDHSDEGYVECSECGSATNCDGNIADLHFCFSCGAEMESEE